ncbi:MAG: TetR/AcrR family transcriptional regulator [Thermoanaerobaculia bacterium]
MTKHAPETKRREQILVAAGRCIARDGYRGTSVDEIVREAGLSKGAFYWYFKSKSDVLESLWKERWRAYSAELRGSELPPSGYRELLAGITERILRVHAVKRGESPVTVEFWAMANQDRRMKRIQAESFRRTREAIGRIVEAGIRRGEIRRDVDVRGLASQIQALYNGLILAHACDAKLPVLRLWRNWVENLFKGISPR